MPKVRYGEDISVQPILAADDIVATTTRTANVNCQQAQWVTFLVNVGDLTTGAGATCDGLTITVEASTIASTAGTPTAIAYEYRLSSAVGTHAWGAITAGTSDGIAFSCSDIENCCILIDVDPALLPARGEAYTFVRLCLTPSSTTLLTVGAEALIEPRYPGNSIPSSS